MTILSILRPLEIFHGHLIWYIFPRFGILYQEKSGNPEMDHVKGATYIFQTSLNICTYSSLNLAGEAMKRCDNIFWSSPCR
jgi:hypothetical protein